MTNSDPPVIGFRLFLVMALVWLALAYIASQQIASLSFGFVVISVLIFAVPVALSGRYSSAVNQTRVVSYYKTSGRAYKLLSGRVIRSILWVIWGADDVFLHAAPVFHLFGSGMGGTPSRGAGLLARPPEQPQVSVR